MTPGTYSAYDVLMVSEMRLAVLAAVDLRGIKVDVVRQAHGGGGRADRSGGLKWLCRFLLEVKLEV